MGTDRESASGQEGPLSHLAFVAAAVIATSVLAVVAAAVLPWGPIPEIQLGTVGEWLTAVALVFAGYEVMLSYQERKEASAQVEAREVRRRQAELGDALSHSRRVRSELGNARQVVHNGLNPAGSQTYSSAQLNMKWNKEVSSLARDVEKMEVRLSVDFSGLSDRARRLREDHLEKVFGEFDARAVQAAHARNLADKEFDDALSELDSIISELATAVKTLPARSD